MSSREKVLIIIFLFVLGLSNLFLAYQIIDLQMTVTELFEMVYKHDAFLRMIEFFKPGTEV
tara:strand:- start:97 stop:279 length:183 start_codon:yes stop_codon:yes gene_type:complete